MDETSTKAEPINLSLFLELLSASCLLLLSQTWISKFSSLMNQVTEEVSGNMISLQCFSSQMNLPSPLSLTGVNRETIGATWKNIKGGKVIPVRYVIIQSTSSF